ncbi:MAG TPA: SusC/RagA family TonB-linked outer membrane protein [Gemmatimonadales bacterium]|nr:SusC/RagA family TonB-linked outer membrane protein [Gemmatimonadales bacterium]
MTTKVGRIAAGLVAGAQLWLAVPGAAAAPAPVRFFAGSVAGRVTDVRSGLGLAGTTVEVQGTRLAATSGDDGRYRIANVPAGSHVIAVRRIGYSGTRSTVTVADNQEATADFALAASAYSLEEVVVTGTAGGEQRRTLGNAVATIDASTAMARSAAPNLTSLLSSRTPGAIITPGSGRIGAGPTIQIRGRSTLSLGSEPLVYVDGVRVNNAVNQGPLGGFLGAQNAGVASRLNDINPEDIESIEVIRGPAASTIYGTEAANGVIQIITKKGGGGAARWTASIEQGTQRMEDPAGRIPTNYFKDASGTVVPWNGWQQEVDSGRAFLKSGHVRSYNVGVSGGRDQLTYFVSGTYNDETGIEPNNSGKGFSGRANVGFSPSSTMDVQANLGYVRNSAHLGADNGLSPFFNAFFGHKLLFPANRGFFTTPPEVPQRLYDNSSAINRFTGGTTFIHHPVDWFSQRLVVGVDFTSDDARALEKFAPPDLAPFLTAFGSAAGRIAQTLRNNTIATGDYSATARFKLNSKFNSSSSLGANFVKKQLKTSVLAAINFPAPGLETVSSAATPSPPVQTEVVNTTLGVWGQEQIGWNDRLFLTAALRVDNNSAFGEDFKWVTYPKLSASWVMSEEPFWGTLSKSINTFKLRAAYGQSGNQPDAFAALRTFISAPRPTGDAGLSPGSFGNSDLKPERGKELEFGFEANLFNRLSLDFTYFSKHTTDAILLQPTAPSGGFPGTQAVNVGETKNHGIELQAAFQALAKRDLSWEVLGNIATNKDEVVDLGILPFAGSTNIRSTVGYPINAYWSRRVVSADRDANDVITNILCDGGAGKPPVACSTAPEQFIGTQTPKVTGAVSSTVTLWQNLTLYGLLDFKRGHTLLNANEFLRCGGVAPLCDAVYNRAAYDTHLLASIASSSIAANVLEPFMQKASFFRLSEVSVAYALPPRWFKRLGISGARLSLAGRNLHTWTKYRGLDPESRAGVTDQALIPPLQRFVATLHLAF